MYPTIGTGDHPYGLITVDDDTTIEADLVIFAEGRAATTAVASGFEIVDGGYHQRAVVGTLHSQRPHQRGFSDIHRARPACSLYPCPIAVVSIVSASSGHWANLADDLQRIKRNISLIITQTSEFERVICGLS